nr:RNA-directed DNA polymerase, eukaryota [Tanacetum cinerariifolium]
MGIGVSSNVVAAAASLIGCSILTAPFNYLGVKVGSNMSRITSWDDVISKVSSRLSKWKLKLLSIGGRLFILKSVLTSIPLYHMSIFKVPIGVLNHLESVRRNFFYGVDGSDRKLAWIGWTSKKNGGLGVSSFFAHNRALLFKWVWRFITDGSSLWTRFIKAIFGEVALKVLYKRLYALAMCKSISVAEKMGHPSLSHSFRRIPRGGVKQENYDLLCSKVNDLVLPNISDRWCWSLEGSQVFTVKSSRILIDNTILPKAEVPTRCLRVVPIKCSKLVASKDKEVNMKARDSDDASEELEKFKLGSGKIRLADDKTLDIAGVGDVVLKTSFDISWTLKDVRYISDLKRRLILIGQLNKEGYHDWYEHVSFQRQRFRCIARWFEEAAEAFFRNFREDKETTEAAARVVIGNGSNEIRYSFRNLKSHQVIQSRDITFVDSNYRAWSTTDLSSLTKPIQKNQVVLVDILDNLAEYDNIVAEHGMSSKITQSLVESSNTSEGFENSGSFKDSGRSDEKDSKDAASFNEGGSKTSQSYSEALSSKESVQWKKAINEDMVSLEKNQTCSLVRLPARKKASQSLWIFKVKEEQNSSERYEAPLL